MSKSPSQFATDLVRLQLPERMAGSTISVGGFSVEPDADGVVEVPPHLAGELRAHGLTPAAEKAAAPRAARTQQATA